MSDWTPEQDAVVASNMPLPEKRCRGECGQVKPLDQFYRKTDSPDGYAHTCKECAADYQRAYSQRPEIRERLRVYRQRPEVAAKRREYHRSPACKASQARYRAKPEAAERIREWQRGYQREYKQRRKAKRDEH